MAGRCQVSALSGDMTLEVWDEAEQSLTGAELQAILEAFRCQWDDLPFLTCDEWIKGVVQLIKS